MLEKYIKINKLEFHNRLVLPPMATAKSKVDGQVTQELIDYYELMTKGGHVGLVILEHAYMDPRGQAGDKQMSLTKEVDPFMLEKLVKTIQASGSKVFAQINHAGAKVPEERKEILGVSKDIDLLPQSSSPNFKVMDQQDIEDFKKNFLYSARLVKELGMDGLEIHSAHGYLLNQFYSPLSNKREDDYGPKTIKSRLKLHLELIQLLRKELGDFPLALRLGVCDYLQGGSTIEDSVQAAGFLEGAGLDILDISGGLMGYRSESKIEGYFKDISLEIKKSSKLPLILTGGVVTRAGADKLLDEGAADLIGVGRAFLKNPLWAAQAFEK